MLPGCWRRQEAAHPAHIIHYHSFPSMWLKLSRLAAQKEKNQNVEYQSVLIINCASPP